MRSIFIPLPPIERLRKFTGLAAALKKWDVRCVKDWIVEDLKKSTADAYRLQRQRAHRLVAELKQDDYLLDHIKNSLTARHPGIEINAIATRLYFEEYGLGMFEATVAISGDSSDPQSWYNFLRDRSFWGEMDFYSMIIGGKLSVQQCWLELRDAFASAMTENGLNSFWQLEAALKAVVGQEIIAETNDFLWTQCMDLTLFWNPELELTSANIRAVVPIVHEVGLINDYQTNIERTEVASRQVKSLTVDTTAYAIANGSNMFIAMYSGFGMVALVHEPQPWRTDGGDLNTGFEMGRSPSRKIAALRRTMLLNYGATTTATNVLKQFLTKSLTISGSAGAEFHDNLRRIIAAFAVIKHEARCELIESDDIETYVYRSLYEKWNLPSQLEVLNEMIVDADNAASRLSESYIHTEERAFTIILILLTLITIGGIASEMIGFIFHPEEFHANTQEAALRAIFLFTAFCLMAAIVWLGRRLLVPRGEFLKARKRGSTRG